MTTAVARRAETPLRELAGLYGVQTAYYDVDRRRRQPDREALLAVLRALGAPAARLEDAPAAVRERRMELWRRPVEPVTVAWDGKPSPVTVRLPAASAPSVMECRLQTEDGDDLRWQAGWAELPLLHVWSEEGERFEARGLTLPAHVPHGYHQLLLELPGRAVSSLLVSAPRRAYVPAAGAAWGVFLPLFALRSRRSTAAGDFRDLAALAEWVADLGGDVVATLPLFAAFLDRPCDPSPYTPVSRLFWNEFYVDISAVPEMASCPAAREMVASAAFQREAQALRAGEHVDYRRGMALKRRVLSELSRCLWSGASSRRAELESFLQERPEVETYARFRAALERRGEGWRRWPEPLRSGDIGDGEFDEDARRYHLYAQWIAEEQLRVLSDGAKARHVSLYFDLPLGVHAEGYDAWRHQGIFAQGVSAGAPPDGFFAAGQDWGFPPLHPERVREQGYAYLRSVLVRVLTFASVLRIDHVMGLSRLYWIPEGLEARRGLYVRYRDEELYAIFCLESHRRRAMIVGEDLGTVPRYVEAALGRHRFQRMYVLQFQLTPDGPASPGRNAVASLNTHDMPTFAAAWQGLQAEKGTRTNGTAAVTTGEAQAAGSLLRFLRAAGHLAPDVAAAGDVLRACLRFLARSRSRLLLVNLEDLWLEIRPQNVPGTSGGTNWRRRARYRLEEMRQMPEVTEVLREISPLRASWRRRGKAHAAPSERRELP